jgi:hypothetical protein
VRVFHEPGADTTPFPDAVTGFGWEDDESTPRSAAELIVALQSTWALVAGCLDRWSPAMLGEEFSREINGQLQVHTRQSVIMRLISHDAYHCGGISQTLGAHGLSEIDLWRP